MGTLSRYRGRGECGAAQQGKGNRQQGQKTSRQRSGRTLSLKLELNSASVFKYALSWMWYMAWLVLPTTGLQLQSCEGC